MKISGFVEKIIFTNSENGYTVCLLETVDGEDCIVGIMPLLAEGEHVDVEGDYVNHNVYGRQFVVSSFVSKLPADETAMLRYLSSGIVKGVRAKTARAIIDTFGADSLDVIENYPDRLAMVKGISPAKAIKISESMKENVGVKNILLYFQQFGITPVIAFKIFKQWGARSYDMIRTNPYLLCDIHGVTFEKADEIAENMDFDRTSPHRIRAGIKYVLTYNLNNNGHTFLPKQPLRQTVIDFLEVEDQTVDCQLEGMIEEGVLVYREKIGNGDAVYLAWVYECEVNIANRLILASKFSHPYKGDFERDISVVERSVGIEFAPTQKAAIKEACCNSIMILTGGPGTGKTTTLKGLLRIFEMKGMSFALAAPTGRAAKRITELCGKEAKTIHRLLEYAKQGDREVFTKNRENQLKYDAVVIDESSMIDLPLFNALLNAVPVNAVLILLGDANQLPPVGPGSVFKDIIAGGLVTTVELNHIFRQAEKSLIITNAHKIICGELPEMKEKKNDFFFLPATSSEGVAELVRDLYSRRLPNAYGFDVLKDIQVLCPTRKTATGTVALNEILRDSVNPSAPGVPEIKIRNQIYRKGDKVMQIRNNYDITFERDNGELDCGVFNGDIGVIEDILPLDESIVVRYDDKTVTYTSDLIEDITLAYAVTVHKSQGSEFPAVILPLFEGAQVLYTRNLLYTAVTRAKSILIIVGSAQKVGEMVRNNITDKRYSGLKFKLWELIKNE